MPLLHLDWRHRVAALVFCLQLLLVFDTYRSTDFEVHRNWLAITYSLPISQWYYEATSEWTLDYPPLFAWFEWALARAAALLDPRMLVVTNLGYASAATVLFQRLSVCATSLVLVAAMMRATRAGRDDARGLTAFVLVVCNAGLIMVDNIHFQYNSVLLGLLVYSLLMLEEQRFVLGGVLFAVLLNMKHLFAYLAPVYFVFLLKHYVLDGSGSSSSSSSSSGSGGGSSGSGTGAGADLAGALRRLLLLGSGVLLVCGVSFGPFIAMGQLDQVLSRLFPFARGLCHAYWAPNAWALYSFADKLAAAAAARAGLLARAASANMAGGVVGVSSYLVLPNVGGAATAGMVLAALAPALAALWRAPDRRRALAMLAPALAYANLCGFMFGYHVHEKAALTVEIPLALAAVRGGADWGRQYVLLSSAAHVGIFPLLFGVQEVPIRWLLALLYYVLAVWGLATIHGGGDDQQQQQQKGQKRAVSAGGGGSSSGAAQAATPAAGVRTRRQAAAQPAETPAHATPATQGALPRRKQQGAAAGPGGAGLTMHQCCSWLPPLHRAYLAGLVVLELYCTLGHRALFGERLPFVPLMLTSVYCALGITWVWAWMAWWFAQQCFRE